MLEPPLDKLSLALDYPILFFYRASVSPISKEEVSFRALSTMSAQTLHRALATATLANDFNDWLDRNYHTPDTSLPTLDGPPAAAAQKLRNIWNLYDRPVHNMQHLLERHGVRIFSLARIDNSVDAFSYFKGERAVIFLNTTKSAERLRFDLAHELGHLVLHRRHQVSQSKIVEREADEFAGAFLVHSSGLQKQVIGEIRLDDVFALKRHWKVSALAMVEQLWRLRIVSEWSRRQWIVELSKKGYRKGEPDGGQKEASRLLTQLVKLAIEDGRSLRRIAGELGFGEQDIEDLFFGLGLTSVVGHDQPGPAPRMKPPLRRVQ